MTFAMNAGNPDHLQSLEKRLRDLEGGSAASSLPSGRGAGAEQGALRERSTGRLTVQPPLR